MRLAMTACKPSGRGSSPLGSITPQVRPGAGCQSTDPAVLVRVERHPVGQFPRGRKQVGGNAASLKILA